jgi:hypothetical protein
MTDRGVVSFFWPGEVNGSAPYWPFFAEFSGFQTSSDSKTERPRASAQDKGIVTIQSEKNPVSGDTTRPDDASHRHNMGIAGSYESQRPRASSQVKGIVSIAKYEKRRE